MSEYLEKIIKILSDIEEQEKEKLDIVSDMVANTIIDDGLIHVFGCGHSHLPGLDVFYRAGGLANVSPMLDTDLMLHNGAVKSSRIEELQGIGSEIFRRYKPEEKDVIFIISTSGKNNVPIEVADSAKLANVKSVGISSSAYYNKGGNLHNHVDVALDNKVPYGDACVEVGDVMMGGLSTAASCFILNSALIEGAKKALNRGFKPPIYLSGNIDGGREHNIKLEDIFLGRIKHL